MIIKKIHINNFGKLVDFEMEFKPGQNIIYGENEKGKSTIMAFIKAMFYGFPTSRKSDLLKDNRKKYMTWGETSVSGSLEFVFNGKNFRIERSFGKTKAKDTRKLINKSLNKEETIPNSQEIGKIIFDMNEESFERSLFIGQIGSVIDSDKNENEIQKKMQNLASAGDETQSFSDVEKNLKTKMESIISRSKRIGELDVIKKNILYLENEKIKSIEAETKKTELKEEYERNLQELDYQNSKRIKIKSQNEKIDKYDEYFKCKKIIELNDSTNTRKNLIDQLQEKLTIGDKVITSEYLTKLNEMVDVLYSSFVSKKELEGQFEEEKANFKNLSIDSTDLIDKKIYDQINGLINKGKEIQDEINNKNYLLLKSKQDFEKASNLNELQSSIKTNDEKINSYKNDLIKLKDENKTKKKSLIALILVLIGCGIVALSFIDLFGDVMNILRAVGVAITGIGAVIFALKIINKKKSLKSIEKEENDINYEIRRLNELNKNNEENIGNIKKQLANNGSGVYKTIDHEGVKKYYENINSQIKELNNEYTRIDNNIKVKITELNLRDISEFFEKFEKDSVTINKLDFMKDSILKQQEKIEENEKKYSELFEKIKNYANNMDLPLDPELMRNYVNKLSKDYLIYKNNKNNYHESIKNLENELDGLDINIVKDKYDSLEQELDLDEESIIHYKELKANAVNFKEQLGNIENEIEQLKDTLAELKSKMVHEFSEIKEISEIEEEIRLSKSLENYYENEYAALSFAKEVMEESFEQMQQNFGPIINERCAEILHQLTGGKYKELMVSKDFNVNVIDPEKGQTFEWKYLSNGTIDQVYFSLRLAISEIFINEKEPLPILLDDSFLQYDDFRAKLAMEFLEEYSIKHDIQIILFTCHKLFLEIENKSCKVNYMK